MTDRVQKALDTLRPFFQKDGGDIDLLGMDEGLVEQVIKEAAPATRAVEAVLF